MTHNLLQEETSSVGSASTIDNSAKSEAATLKRKKGRRGRKKKVNVVNTLFKYTCHMKEDHSSEIFAVNFNHHLRDGDPYIFASVGRNRVCVYECGIEGGLKPILVFADPNVSFLIFCSESVGTRRLTYRYSLLTGYTKNQKLNG